MVRAVNSWLDRLPTWQFVASHAGSILLSMAVAAAVLRHFHPHSVLGYRWLAAYGVCFAIPLTTSATWRRRERLRRGGK
jgi:hypothetical protein